MWTEVNCLFGAIAVICMGICITFTLFISVLVAFLCIVAMGMVIMGNMLIGYQIKHNHLDILMDPCPASQEVCVLMDFGGNVDFVKVKKGPLGKREFMKYRKEASIINTGDYQLRFINGNRGFVGHESYDKNVNLYKTEALDKLKGEDVKEIFFNMPKVARDIDGRV